MEKERATEEVVQSTTIRKKRRTKYKKKSTEEKGVKVQLEKQKKGQQTSIDRPTCFTLLL